MPRAKGTFMTADRWVAELAPTLPGSAGWVLMELSYQSNYDEKGLTVADLMKRIRKGERTCQAALEYLVEKGHVIFDPQVRAYFVAGVVQHLTQALRRNLREKWEKKNVLDDKCTISYPAINPLKRKREGIEEASYASQGLLAGALNPERPTARPDGRGADAPPQIRIPSRVGVEDLAGQEPETVTGGSEERPAAAPPAAAPAMPAAAPVPVVAAPAPPAAAPESTPLPAGPSAPVQEPLTFVAPTPVQATPTRSDTPNDDAALRFFHDLAGYGFTASHRYSLARWYDAYTEDFLRLAWRLAPTMPAVKVHAMGFIWILNRERAWPDALNARYAADLDAAAAQGTSRPRVQAGDLIRWPDGHTATVERVDSAVVVTDSEDDARGYVNIALLGRGVEVLRS